MSLKRLISKEAYNALSAGIKELYSERGDNYALDLSSDDDDVTALRAAKDHETAARKAAEKKLRDLENEAERKKVAENEEKLRNAGKFDELEAAYKKKLADAEIAHKEAITKKDTFIRNSLIDGEAGKLAGEISNNPKLMSRFIKDRLTVDFDGDTPTLRVLDASGKVTASTLADLKKELVDNPDFSSLIVGTKARGGAASEKGSGRPVPSLSPGGGASGKNASPSFAQMRPSDLVAALADRAK